MSAEKHGVSVAIYLVITTLLSGIFWTLIIAGGHLTGGGGLYAVGLMWSPAIAAFLTVRICHLDVRSLGLRWGANRYALWGYLIPLAYAAIAYGLTWSFGLGSFPNPHTLSELAQKLGWHIRSTPLFIAAYVVLLGTLGLVNYLAHALGEEIGWRGLLTPRLVSCYGFTGGSLVTGAIWGAWHMPVLLFADYHSGAPWWFAMTCFFVLVVAISTILTWLRLRSGSVWPCAILHASHNLFIQSFFTPLTLPRGRVTSYVIDEFGVAVPIVAVFFALFFWLRRRQTCERALRRVAGSVAAVI